MKALTVGGANGIGAAICKELLERNYDKIYVADIAEPVLKDPKIVHIPADLTKINVQELYFDDVDTLVITAGVGRLNFFETFDIKEIEKTFKINALATVELLNLYYKKISGDKEFHCAVFSSIAGIVNSPLYALYSATKASVVKACEALNSELEFKGVKNRILNVAPGKIEGTNFHGNTTDFDGLKTLSCDVLDRMFNNETLFIPNGEVYENVVKRNNENPEKFGKESIRYKLEKNAKLQEKKPYKVGYMSGTFDLFHIGHLNVIRRAKAHCDYLVVGVHPDASHKNKQTFISFEERKEIVRSLKYVDQVIDAPSEDSVAYDVVHYDRLFVGSDYKGSERFERYEKYLAGKAEIVYFEYTKTTSSSQLRSLISNKLEATSKEEKQS